MDDLDALIAKQLGGGQQSDPLDALIDAQLGGGQGAPTTKRVPIVGRGAGVIGYRDVPVSDLQKGTLERLGGAADDAARNLANGITFGGADKAAAAISPGDYTQNLGAERAKSAGAMERNPGIGEIEQMTGSAMLPMGTGLSLLNKAKGAPLAVRALLGGAEGAAYGGLNTAGHDDSALMHDKANNIVEGMGTGAAFGGAIPVIGSGVARVYSALAPFFRGAAPELSPRASGILENAVNSDSTGVHGLSAFGPQAMMADAGPSTLGLTQGVAMRPGDARSVALDALEARNAGRNQRLSSDLNASFGPNQDPTLLKQTIGDARKAITGPQYEAAFKGAPVLDATSALANIGKASETMTPAGRSTLTGVTAAIKDAQSAATPEIAARRLMSLRQELDAQIAHDPIALSNMSAADRAAQNALKSARAEVDGLVKSVPGIQPADATAAEYAKLREGVDTGFDSLTRQLDASPEVFQGQIQSASPAMRSAIQGGMRGRLEAEVGQNANDLAKLKSVLGEPQDWNSQKLEMAFSPGQREGMTRAVERENRFAQSFNDVARNSQTAPRSAAAKTFEERDTSGVPNNPLEWPAAAGKWAGRKVINALANGSNEAVRSQVARALTAQGSERDKLIAALLGAAGKRSATAAQIRNSGLSPVLYALMAREVGSNP